MNSFCLSVDMDFWNDCDVGYAERFLDRLGKKIKEMSLPVLAVMNHHQLLDFVNRHKADTLLHIDEHSDLSDTDDTMFNCGTWVGYVNWRKFGRFKWYHAISCQYGDCNGESPIFSPEKVDEELTDWAYISDDLVKPDICIPKMENCTGVGVCLSPGFIMCNELEDIFRKWLDKFNFPYKKGCRHEDGLGVRRLK